MISSVSCMHIFDNLRIGGVYMRVLSTFLHVKCEYHSSCPQFTAKGKYCEGLDYPKCGIFLKRKREHKP